MLGFDYQQSNGKVRAALLIDLLGSQCIRRFFVCLLEHELLILHPLCFELELSFALRLTLSSPFDRKLEVPRFLLD